MAQTPIPASRKAVRTQVKKYPMVSLGLVTTASANDPKTAASQIFLILVHLLRFCRYISLSFMCSAILLLSFSASLTRARSMNSYSNRCVPSSNAIWVPQYSQYMNFLPSLAWICAPQLGQTTRFSSISFLPGEISGEISGGIDNLKILSYASFSNQYAPYYIG